MSENKRTRGHDFMLVKGQSRLDVRQYSFSQRTVNEWNKLPADCVHCSSINIALGQDTHRVIGLHVDSR